jgi:hypothetical protein
MDPAAGGAVDPRAVWLSAVYGLVPAVVAHFVGNLAVYVMPRLLPEIA